MADESKTTTFSSGMKVVIFEIVTLALLFVLQQVFTR